MAVRVSNVELPSVAALFADVSARGLKRHRRWSPGRTPRSHRTPTAAPPTTRVRTAAWTFLSGCPTVTTGVSTPHFTALQATEVPADVMEMFQ